MEWWQLALAVAGGSSLGTILGALLTYLVGSQDVKLRSRVETIKVFMATSARAAGRLDDGGPADIAEKIAAVHLLADLGSRDKWLHSAALGQLRAVEAVAMLREAQALAVAELAGDEYARAVAQDGMNPSDNPWGFTSEAQDLERARAVSSAVGVALSHLHRPPRQLLNRFRRTDKDIHARTGGVL